ncbi:heterokaryon incompatibility protein-domain-containing protein [Dactylonectria estremocensis]|uniref:Heterokaryon incompatibility protein-domain-containing protein n=1 Tax=Dactylonectria estremocensis TaxID=1079267 RepID=A0A9P9ENS5_9HYPO|nr:heterokaryon incompatibility protein-domain-containing protein [Dactylonectria estremocensis]
MFGEYFSPIGLAISNQSALLGLNNVIQKMLYTSMEVMARKWHHYGETNKYSKQSIDLSDGPMIEKPSSLDRLQYPRHQYTPLYHGELAATSVVGGAKPVRLLELLQPETTNSELIRCKVHEYSLEKAPEYEAISYTWGVVKTQDFPVIVVTGNTNQGNTLEPVKLEAVLITRHLYAALSRLRHPTQSRLLWADQICINQINKGEKSKQVRQMGDIYKKSKRAVIWLGEEDGDKDVIEEMFTSLRNKTFTSVRDDAMLFANLLVEESTYTGLIAMSPKQRRRQAVTRLLNRTWFSRVWVFQEAVVSPKVEVIYGSLKLPLKELFRLARAVFKVENAAGGYARSIAKTTVPQNFFGLVMQALQQLRATKELDLIYAFVGFEKPQANPKIEVDYKLPVRTVWMNAARTIIQNSRSLDVFAATRGDTKCKYDLPSWVPDFSNCYPYARPITAPDFNTAFKASGDLPHTWEGAADTETLIVKGQIIGTVMWFSPVNFDLEGYNTIVHTLLADGAFGHEQPLGYSMDEIIWVCENEDEIQAAHDVDKIQAANDIARPEFGEGAFEILEKLRDWGLIVQQKWLFLSDEYDMGLVPKTALVGDLICLLHGSKVPCVLRRSGVGEERYRIISQCYLDGKMNCNGSPERRAWLEEGAKEFVLV